MSSFKKIKRLLSKNVAEAPCGVYRRLDLAPGGQAVAPAKAAIAKVIGDKGRQRSFQATGPSL